MLPIDIADGHDLHALIRQEGPQSHRAKAGTPTIASPAACVLVVSRRARVAEGLRAAGAKSANEAKAMRLSDLLSNAGGAADELQRQVPSAAAAKFRHLMDMGGVTLGTPIPQLGGLTLSEFLRLGGYKAAPVAASPLSKPLSPEARAAAIANIAARAAEQAAKEAAIREEKERRAAAKARLATLDADAAKSQLGDKAEQGAKAVHEHKAHAEKFARKTAEKATDKATDKAEASVKAVKGAAGGASVDASVSGNAAAQTK